MNERKDFALLVLLIKKLLVSKWRHCNKYILYLTTLLSSLPDPFFYKSYMIRLVWCIWSTILMLLWTRVLKLKLKYSCNTKQYANDLISSNSNSIFWKRTVNAFHESWNMTKMDALDLRKWPHGTWCVSSWTILFLRSGPS